jgi:hypothetical protein
MKSGTLQEHGLCWLGLFAGHGAHGAGACRALFVEAEFRHGGQPGRLLTFPLNRQGTAAAAHPYACSSKGCSSTASCTPLQHLLGSTAHTHTRTHTNLNTNAHAYTHRHTHTHTYTCIHTNTRMHTHTNAQTHRHTHAHTHMHTHVHTHAYACTRCVRDGLRKISASLAVLPHLSLQLFCDNLCLLRGFQKCKKN